MRVKLIPRPLLWPLLAICLGLTLPMQVRAETTPDLQALRLSLAHYDLEQGGALRALTALHAVCEQNPAGSEARFLRAAVAADLMILAQVRNDPALLEGVAKAVGAEPKGLFALLVSELEQVTRTHFRQPAHEALEALSRFHEDHATAWRELSVPASAKRDLLYLLAVAQAARDATVPVAALAPFAIDPCATQCGAAYAPFDVEGRRAVSALAEAGHALARLRKAALDGDPFATALSPQLDDMQAELMLLTLRPMPRLDDLASADAGQLGVPTAPDLMLLLSGDGVRFGFVPSVKLSAAGELTLLSPSSPTLPETQPLVIPNKLPPYLLPLPQLVRRLRDELGRDSQLRVAVALAAGTDADLLTRVLVSVRRVGCEEVLLLGRGPLGATAGLSLSLLSKLEAEQAIPAALKLQVRPGSYSLRQGGVLHHIDHKSDEPGRRADLEELDTQLASHRYAVADVSFMLQMPADSLADALFRIAPAAASTRLLLPASALDESTEFKRSLRQPKHDASARLAPPG